MDKTIPPLQTESKPRYTKKGIPSPTMTADELEECANIARRFLSIKNRSEFARDNACPGKDDRAKGSIIYSHINALRPISMASAIAYARGFRCALEEISPRLAKEAKASSAVIPSPSAPNTVSLVYSTTPGYAKPIVDEVKIRQFDTGGSMGTGVLLRDQPGVIKSWTVTMEWLSKNIKSCTGHANLSIVTGFGDSMRPMFNPGDPLVIDQGVNTVEFDAIYFFRVGNEGFLKRLQRIPGEGMRVISENKAYESWTIKPDMDFEVFGRVLKVWCSEEF